MKNNFEACVALVKKDEGGYSNDPSDSGGATNFGITIVDYKKYINKNGTPDDVRSMTWEQAKQIYKTKYWNALDCDNLPSGVDYTCFDYGIHSGLQRPRNALKKFPKLAGLKLVDAINDERATFLKNLANRRPKDQKYLNGWLNRVARVRAYSHTLVAKKDTTSGPAGGMLAGFGAWATLTEYFHAHPYTSIAIAVAVGAAIWAVVHYTRNRNV